MDNARAATGLAAMLLSLLSMSPAFAHHSFAMFDHSKSEALQGTVKNFNWGNPHISIELVAAKPEGGPPVDWLVEGPSVSMLIRNGWSRSLMKSGDKITLTMNPLRSGALGGSLLTVTVGGKTLSAH